MRRNYSYFLLALIMAGLICFLSCKKDSSNSGSHPNTPVDEQVTAGLDGRVLDENGVPVKDAVVTSGLATTNTDVNGVFHFGNISMSSRFGFVKVAKQGYFTGSRTILTNADGGNYVEISLIPRVSKGSFAAGTGGTVTVQGNNTVVFQGGSFVVASSNAAYTGNVNVFAAYLDPTDSTLPAHMPGTLRGIGLDNKETGLQTYGMIDVELEDDAGNKLQIASGKTATINVDIPASLQGTAPSSIPLWYFNDTTGKWMEQGAATRQGNSYTGQVGHFTYWNCDAPIGTVSFKVYLKDQQGNPLSYNALRFVSDVYGMGAGYTDSSGYSQGLLLKGQSMVMQVLNRCGEVIYTQNIGPTLADLDLGTITITLSPTGLTLTGTVVDCYNNPVTDGFLKVTLEGLNYAFAITNGQVTAQINRCNALKADAQITAGDYGSNQIGASFTISVTNGSQDIGQVSACGIVIDQFIVLSINGKSIHFTTPPDVMQYAAYPAATSIYAGNTAGSLSIDLPFLPGTGSYTPKYLSMFSNGNGNSGEKISYHNTTDTKVNVTSFGDVEGYIEGNFSGSVIDSAGAPGYPTYPLTGNFKIRRTN